MAGYEPHLPGKNPAADGPTRLYRQISLPIL